MSVSSYYKKSDKYDLLKELGRVFKIDRISLGCKAEEVAKLVPCTTATIYNFEKGILDSLFIMMRYSEALNILREQAENADI